VAADDAAMHAWGTSISDGSSPGQVREARSGQSMPGARRCWTGRRACMAPRLSYRQASGGITGPGDSVLTLTAGGWTGHRGPGTHRRGSSGRG
jgi:hypothetical protein